MLNDHAPTRSPGLKTASAALGALAVGALATVQWLSVQ
jgi:hypothetical protein